MRFIFTTGLTVLYRQAVILMKKETDFSGGIIMSVYYRIRVKTHLEPYWAHWFGGMTLTNLENGEAEMDGPVENQEALHRILEKLRDLNINLVSVEQVEALSDWS
jgi:hypothetical protein